MPPTAVASDPTAPALSAGVRDAAGLAGPPPAIGMHDGAMLRLLDRAFERATGSPRIDGNAVRILRDAQENFSAWLDAIGAARRTILFESYLWDDDEVGQRFVDALSARAHAGVRVYVVYDWLGSRGTADLWAGLRAAGVQVRVFNRFSVDSPLGWVSRDHRKTIAIDGAIGYVTGVCVSAAFLGDPARGLEPWRDTGIEIRGPAVAELEEAFGDVWKACGGPALPAEDLTNPEAIDRAGDIAVRVIAGRPSAAGVFRLDQLIASAARKYLWLTDAYFVGLSPYVQALCAAARDGVDVRLLLPGVSDIAALQPLSRAGYRPLLAAGVKIYEWNGTMLHAKTAVADGLWARVGSTNLNFASFIQNWELDVAIEDPEFAEAMAAMYQEDLSRATEIVLTDRNRVRRAGDGPAAPRPRPRGSARRAAAGALSVGNAMGAALTNRRLLGPAESGLLVKLAIGALAIGAIAIFWPWLLTVPVAILALWFGVAMLVKAWSLQRQRAQPHADGGADDAGGGEGREDATIPSSRP
jgi:cardiolipin synthase